MPTTAGIRNVFDTVSIESDDTTLDCQNHVIYRFGSGFSVSVSSGLNGVTIRNCRVISDSGGVNITSASDVLVNRSRFYLHSSFNAIVASTSKYVRVIGSTFHEAPGIVTSGVYLRHTSYSTVDDNGFQIGNGAITIYGIYSDHNLVSSNTVYSTGSATFFHAIPIIGNITGNVVMENTLTGAGFGVGMVFSQGATGNAITGNQIHNYAYAINVFDGSANVINGNLITNNDVAIQFMQAPPAARVFLNEIYSNGPPQVSSTVAVELSDTNPSSPTYQYGNYWGHDCSEPSLFIPGTDSNSVLVVDSFPYGIGVANRVLAGSCLPSPTGCEDTDNDGLYDHEEICGIDNDGDGIIDLDLAALGADPGVRDIFVEVDYMNVPNNVPQPVALQQVVDVFDDHGIKLHIDLGALAPGTDMDLGGGGDIIPTVDYIGSYPPYLPTQPSIPSGLTTALYDEVKAQYSDPARNPAFHYVIYAYAITTECTTLAAGTAAGDTSVTINGSFLAPAYGPAPFIGEIAGDRFIFQLQPIGPTTSVLSGIPASGPDRIGAHAAGDRVCTPYPTGGLADYWGDDFLISFGLAPVQLPPFKEAIVFMHELGHNLYLHHGGGDLINYKPNYLSIMNYFFTSGVASSTTCIPADIEFRLDYSGTPLLTLNESALVEAVGIQDFLDCTLYKCPGGIVTAWGTGFGPIDWNCNGIDTDTCGQGGLPFCDIDGGGVNNNGGSPPDEGPLLEGYDDWANLRLDFRNNPLYDPAALSFLYTAGDEADLVTWLRLNELPPISPIAIDVKPGSVINPINLKSKGKIPVAILTTAELDAAVEIDLATVTFGRLGVEAEAVSYSIQDVDQDGDDDLLCRFRTQETGLQPTDEFANLRAITINGLVVGGVNRIQIVPPP
jgi:hypothetical protein